jgi:hypothetical protein
MFTSMVALERFQLRTTGLLEPPRIRLIEPLPFLGGAVRTISLGAGVLLHGLDDESYLDPSGFWIQKARTAAFAVENWPESSSGGLAIRLANGGVENAVEIRGVDWSEKIVFAPWEEREQVIPGERELVSFSIRSESGFRPADLDPESSDRRPLGILLRAASPFD